MKLAFQCLLVVTMVLSLLAWWISTAKLHISSRLPEFSNYDGEDWQKTFSEWRTHVEKPIIQQTTHADETFWVCLCAFILTMKVRQGDSMTYDNGEGLVFHFDADWSQPDESSGWVGGWEIRVHQVDLINEETGDPETITDRSEFSGMVSKLTSLDCDNMEAIAKGERKC